MEHEPVLVDEVVDLLEPAVSAGGTLVDGTLGRGGHARRLLDAAPAVRFVGIDKDPDALRESGARLEPYRDRVRLVRDDFSNLATVLERLGIAQVRGVLLDLGVSSPQLDEAHRGFSFRADAPLDMRMNPDAPLSAHDVVNAYDEKDLRRVIRTYGEERFAKQIAHSIVRARPIETTTSLAETVAGAIPAPARRTGGHPARRTFQALRIEVNDELGALARALPDIVDVLEPGGRVAILSYHSLEDRIVKRFFADQARGCSCPPDFPICTCGSNARLRILTRRPVRPDEREQADNRRSSAAKLRAAERLAVST